MTTFYNINKNFQGVNGYATPFCTQTYSATLAAGVNEAVAVPLTTAMGTAPATNSANTFLAVFYYKPATEFWVANNTTATVPAGGTFAATSSVLLPKAKTVKSGDVINVISAAGGDICIEFYSTQGN
jgi:hypothetical protein